MLLRAFVNISDDDIMKAGIMSQHGQSDVRRMHRAISSFRTVAAVYETCHLHDQPATADTTYGLCPRAVLHDRRSQVADQHFGQQVGVSHIASTLLLNQLAGHQQQPVVVKANLLHAYFLHQPAKSPPPPAFTPPWACSACSFS